MECQVPHECLSDELRNCGCRVLSWSPNPGAVPLHGHDVLVKGHMQWANNLAVWQQGAG